MLTRELQDEKDKLQSTLDSQSVQRREVQQQKYAYTELDNQVSSPPNEHFHGLCLGSRSNCKIQLGEDGKCEAQGRVEK